MSSFTHFSLFDSREEGRCKIVAEFEPIPAGGVPALMVDLCRKVNGPNLPNRERCIGPKCCIHPDGDQVSFESDGWCLILMTRAGVADHAAELAFEGNTEPAAKAADALR